jgi:hypothetical protein
MAKKKPAKQVQQNKFDWVKIEPVQDPIPPKRLPEPREFAPISPVLFRMRRTIKFEDGREFYLEEQSVQTGWAPSEKKPSSWAAVVTLDQKSVLGTALENGTLDAGRDHEKIQRLREEFTTGSLRFQANPEWDCLEWERECPRFRLAPNQDLTRLWHKWETFRVRTYGTDPGLFLQWCHDERQADVLLSGASHDQEFKQAIRKAHNTAFREWRKAYSGKCDTAGDIPRAEIIAFVEDNLSLPKGTKAHETVRDRFYKMKK